MSAAYAAGLRDWAHRNRRTLVLTGTAFAAAYAAYRVYKSEAASRAQSNYQAFFATFAKYSSALASASETAATLAADVSAFLKSDSGELPNSLKQVLKLLESEAVQQAVRTTAASVSNGLVATGASSGITVDGLVELFMQQLVSSRGRSILGMAVSIASRNSTVAFCDLLRERMAVDVSSSSSAGGERRSWLDDLLASLATPQGERVVSLMVTDSVRSSMTALMESTVGFPADELLSSLSKPEHRELLAELVVKFTGSAVREAFSVLRQTTRGQAANASAHQRAAAAASFAVGGQQQQQQQHHHHHALNAARGANDHRQLLRPESRAHVDATSMAVSLLGTSNSSSGGLQHRQPPASPPRPSLGHHGADGAPSMRYPLSPGGSSSSAAACLAPAAAPTTNTSGSSGNLAAAAIGGGGTGASSAAVLGDDSPPPVWVEQLSQLAGHAWRVPAARQMMMELTGAFAGEMARGAAKETLAAAQETVRSAAGRLSHAPQGLAVSLGQLSRQQQLLATLCLLAALLLYAWPLWRLQVLQLYLP